MRLASLLLLALGACPPGDTPDPTDVEVACEADDVVAVEIGRGVGGAFEPLGPDDVVQLVVAPQGGFGVSVSVAVTGLAVGVEDARLVDVQMDTQLDGVTTGSFTLVDAPLLCSDGAGRIFGVVVGFDPNVYKTNDDLLALDGKLVSLVVTVTDPVTLETGTVTRSATLQVGA